MLAYVLWHWPLPQVAPDHYESSLIEFHQSLNTTKVQGFSQSIVFRSHGAPWTGQGQRGYEDWYLLEESAALDRLNEAAVSGGSKEPHDTTAHAVAGAAGGLFQLQSGRPDAENHRFVSWLAKPRGTSYDDFYSSLQPWTGRPGVSIWRRQMVLGPTPEFGIVSPDRLDLPSILEVTSVELELVWG